jgi:hypothetical protein
MKWVGEMNGAPGVITDRKSVADDYVLKAREIFLAPSLAAEPLRDGRGYTMIVDQGAARKLTPGERPAPQKLSPPVSLYALQLDEAVSAMAAEASDRTVVVLAGQARIEFKTAPAITVDPGKPETVAADTEYRIVGNAADTVLVTFPK